MNRKGLARPGDNDANVTQEAWNRTGATILKGQIGMLDYARTQAETTNATRGSESSCFNNVTPCTHAGVDKGFPVLVALEDIADNAKGTWGVEGIFDVAFLDDDVSATDLDIGDAISFLVAESAVAVSEKLNGALSTDRQLGIALEDAAADSTNTDRLIDASSHRRSAHWWGGLAGAGITNDS